MRPSTIFNYETNSSALRGYIYFNHRMDLMNYEKSCRHLAVQDK